MAEKIFSWLAFPLVMGGAIGVAIHWMERGLEPALAFGGATAGGYLFVIVFERIFPYHRDWNRSRGDFLVDLRHAIVSGGLVLEAIRPLIYAGAIVVGGWLSRSIGFSLWPAEWPIVAQLVLALVVGELPMYWVHRLEHETELLWRFHAVHHSAPRLYWLNAARFHPIDLALNRIGWLGILVLLGCGEAVIALFAIVEAVHGIFQHANLTLRLGPLNWIFSMAELHRWHHSRLLEEANHNYGQNLIVWDVVFGTRYLPDDREPSADTGLWDLSAFPMTYLAQLASPFRWQRIRRESASAAPSGQVS